jgi:hypothetical protein
LAKAAAKVSTAAEDCWSLTQRALFILQVVQVANMHAMWTKPNSHKFPGQNCNAIVGLFLLLQPGRGENEFLDIS